MKPIYPCCCTFIVLLLSVCLRGQLVAPFTTTNVAGGYFGRSDSYFRFDWSLGESSVIQTFSSSNPVLFLTQGLLQPNTEAASLSPYLSYFAINEYRVFPSPTRDKFEVNFSVRESGSMTLQLTNASGAILRSRSFQYYGWGHIEHYDLSIYANGIYFVVATLTPDNSRSNQPSGPTRRGSFPVIKIK